MTIKEFIEQKLTAFGITEANLIELTLDGGFSLENDYTSENAKSVGVAMCNLICELIFAPRQTNINEQGFSASWDFDNLGKYYWWLCKKYGVKPDAEVLSACGISMIRDCTNKW